MFTIKVKLMMVDDIIDINVENVVSIEFYKPFIYRSLKVMIYS